MKAKEYFEKYGDQILKSVKAGVNVPLRFENDPAAQMFRDFTAELREILEIRKANTFRAYRRAIEEQNQKWNAVSKLFIKKYGITPLKRDAFITVLRDRFEEISKQEYH